MFCIKESIKFCHTFILHWHVYNFVCSSNIHCQLSLNCDILSIKLPEEVDAMGREMKLIWNYCLQKVWKGWWMWKLTIFFWNFAVVLELMKLSSSVTSSNANFGTNFYFFGLKCASVFFGDFLVQYYQGYTQIFFMEVQNLGGGSRPSRTPSGYAHEH